MGITRVRGSSSAKVSNIADLLLVSDPLDNETITVGGYYTDGDEGGGEFYFDISSTETADDGTIFGIGTGRWKRIYSGAVSVKWFGLLGNRDLGDTAKFAKLLTFNNIYFPFDEYELDGAYTWTINDVDINLGRSTIYFSGTNTGFRFGTVQDTISNNNISIYNGTITNADFTEAIDRTYIRLNSIEKAYIHDIDMRYVSNGGILVSGVSKKITIKNINIKSPSAVTTVRGIYLVGQNSDYAGQLVDISTIERNATALSILKVSEVLLDNINIDLETKGYGVYLQNTDNVVIQNSYIDIGTSGNRCLAINNHSPNTKVLGNTFKSSNTSTGVLVTQFSTNVTIANNLWLGDFGSGRDLYVAYLAEAFITGNTFNTLSNRKILVDMGGSIDCVNNRFVADSWTNGEVAIEIAPIDRSVVGTSTYGDTATEVSDIFIRNNTFKNLTTPISVVQEVSNAGNIAGIKNILIEDNQGYDFNNGIMADRFLTLTSLSSANELNVNFFRNKTYPSTFSYKAGISDSAGFGNIISKDVKVATFLVSVVSNVYTVTDLGDTGLLKLTASPNGAKALLTPRTNDGQTGTTVAKLINIVPADNNMAYFKITDWSASSLDVTTYNHSDVAILMNSVDTSFYVYLQHTYS